MPIRPTWFLSITLVLVTTAATWLALGTPQDRSRADFAYVNQSGINTLDPAAATWNQDLRVIRNVWQGLMVLDPDTNLPVPGCAATPHVSPDGRVYTFRINPLARWSNGDPVTAQDFVRGWRRAIEPGTAGSYAFILLDYVAGARDYFDWRNDAIGRWQATDPSESTETARRDELKRHAMEMRRRFAQVGFRALNERTFQVRLTRPCPFFPDLVAFPTLSPIHAGIDRLRESVGDTGLTSGGLVVYDPQWTKPNYHRNGYAGVVTNGPYRIAAWQFKRRLRMTPNPFFPGPDPPCETVDMLVFNDLNTALLAYEQGGLDFMPDTSVSYDHELVRLGITSERPDFKTTPVFGSYFYLFNCADKLIDGTKNPFTDPRVRKAFALAVDRDILTRQIAGRGERPISQLVPPDTIPGYSSPTGLSRDPNEARRLLADAGYPGGVGLPKIDLLYSTGFNHGKICQVLADTWRRELGARVSLRGKEVKSFVQDRRSGRFMIARAGWYGDYGDPTTFLGLFKSGNGNNDAGYRDGVFDELLARARNERNAAARLELLARAEQRLIRETLPLLPLYQYSQLLAIKPYVRGIRPNPRLVFCFDRISIRP